MTFNTNNQLINLKNKKWLDRQRHAGKCVSAVLKSCSDQIQNEKTLTLRDLEQEALRIIKQHECIPTFLNYKSSMAKTPFPSAICASINQEVVHGIVRDYTLKNGDVISIDLGATYEGAIADAAYTFIYGTANKTIYDMLTTCQKALMAGIAAAKPGHHLGAIGDAIYKTVKNTQFGLITNYGGHGIDYNKAHAEPFVSNKSSKNDGIRLQSGMSIAIEPMLVFGKNTTTNVKSDGWTVIAPDISCHFEHSIFIKEDETEIITEHGMVI